MGPIGTLLSIKVDSSTFITPKRLFNSPGKKRIRKAHKREVKLICKQLYNSRQQQVRYKRRIETLETLLSSLKQKNPLSSEDLEIIGNFSECNNNLLNRQICKIQKLKFPRLYAPEMHRFALTLHYYSPHAYNYVRKKLYNCLPHAKPLSTWYMSVHGEPGINFESFQMIKHRVENSTYQLIGALMFDEVAIRQHLNYSSSVICVYVNFGEY